MKGVIWNDESLGANIEDIDIPADMLGSGQRIPREADRELDGDGQAFRQTFDVTRDDDLAAALRKVRKGDADVAVEMRGDTLVAHYTQTDQVKAAITQGTLDAFVDGANQAATGQPPRYTLRRERVEDRSLKTIQFVTPGLLGWAVAMSAAFGAAATLQGWRNSKLLRRLQLSPVPAGRWSAPGSW